MSNIVSNVLFPVEQADPRVVVIDAQNDSLPADGKEERAEWLKFAKQQIPLNLCPNWEDLAVSHFFETNHLKRQFYPPVISPPPKSVV